MKPSFYCRGRRRANWEYDNNRKIKDLNENYKKRIIEATINNLRSMDNLQEKLDCINRLKTNNYRYGTKYKYECNLSEVEIKQILDKCNEELFIAYYGKSRVQFEKDNNYFKLKFLFWIVIINIILIALNNL